MNDPIPRHGGQSSQIARRFGVAAETLLDFSANIHPDGPPAGVVAALDRAARDLGSYPDIEYRALKEAASARLDVPAECVLVGNGFVPLLQAALNTLGAQRCVLPVPAFSEYRACAEQAGMEVVPWPMEPHGFAYDREILAQLMRTAGTRCVLLLANPQNPSGALAGAETLLAIVEDAAAGGATVLLDEAFVDYAPATSLVRYAPSLPNLTVFRSVTKFFAMPALRVAYAVSSAERAQEMARAIPIWAVSTPAALAAAAALADESYAADTRNSNEQRRTRMEAQLRELGIVTYASAANFLLLRLPAAVDAQKVWRELIVAEHVLTRSCANFEGLSPGHLRVAVRRDEQNDRLVAAVGRVLRQQGLGLY